ncbi:MAG TPA: thioredoxin family protein [Candidatus Polarisedimenticolaceae bacterium]|nr:thioredoxin family protein [Candidatus Polarisedimenticolaceae bacterium]
MTRRTLLLAIPASALAATLAVAGGVLPMGAAIPMGDVKMKSVDGKDLALADVKKPAGTLVVFTCNHCPFAKMWETRIVELGNTYAAKGIGVVAVNANDPAVAADDSYEKMQERAKQRGMQFPYVVDATSDVARAFGATRTPEVFLFDAEGKLVYHGAVDDNGQEPEKVTHAYLKNALDAVVSGKEVPVKETKSIGCGIKFRS